MATRFFHRHTRKCLDAAVRRVVVALARRPDVREAFLHLVSAVHARSDLARTPPTRGGAFPYLDALVNLARFHAQAVADPYAWSGAQGHPLAVVHSLADHLLGFYPTPRFLGSVWFGSNTIGERDRRNWFVQHARGRAFRTLSLPLAMTRRMEHVFLRSPDHIDIDRAMRRAEVIGLGGDPELADAFVATRFGASYDDGEARRRTIAWLVRWRDAIDLTTIASIVEYLFAVRQDVPLATCTPEAMARRVDAWRRPPPIVRPPHSAPVPVVVAAWPRSRWSDRTFEAFGALWRIVELVEHDQVVREGKVMRHCVASYAPRCGRGETTIWSLRCFGDVGCRSVLTIEVCPRTETIVQLRGPANRAASGEPLAIVRAWAAGEGLAVARAVEDDIARG
jgi:hypothetical protein